MDRTYSKANIKDKDLSFDDDQLNSIKRNLDKDDFNLLNYLVDNEFSRLNDFQQELERVYKPYKQWGKKFRPNIQSRYRLLIDEIESERHQIEKIAELTIKCLEESVPSEVTGVAFLSGGQTEREAAKNLNEINKLNKTGFTMTYSYGRALQQSALKFWSKNIKDITGTQNTFNHRAKMCSLAAQGKWTEEFENKH